MSVGPYDVPAYYMEHKRHQAQGMINAKRVILDVAREFERMTGRGYGLIETCRMEDAECALVLIGSSAGTAKAAVERLRAAGKRVGLVKIRAFRPFPAEELAAALQNCGAVAVMDKCAGFSAAAARCSRRSARPCTAPRRVPCSSATPTASAGGM